MLDAVGSNRVAVFGSSEGGAISSMFSATYPERVSHLILNGSRPCYKWASDYPLGLKPEELKSEVEDFSSLTENEGTWVDGAPSIADDPAAIQWLDTYFRYAASPRALAKLSKLNYDIDYRGVLPAIQAPTLILQREGDRWCGSGHAEYLAKHISGATLRILPGEDHIVWYGNQDEIISETQAFLTGEVVPVRPDRALFTILFLDIVGSTEKLARMGDERWRSVLERLDHFVDRRLESLAGTRIKHTGDGYLLSFRGPTSAVECAMAIRSDAMRLGLQTRTGLHMGECEMRGQDLSGMAVNVAARIMNEAEPDEILVSQIVKDLSLGTDLNLNELTARTLRGIPGDWSLFALSD